MSTARDDILSRIRGALEDIPSAERSEHVAIPRRYNEQESIPHPELVDRFIARVREYKAQVRRVTQDSLAASIASACTARSVRRLLVPADLPPGWAPVAIELVVDRALTYEQLEACDGILTACTLGIAQTGTIVLDSGSGQGRRAATLLPDYHLCVIYDDQIVGLVPEAVARLNDVAHRPDRPITWISGPSATSDIELNRVEGVHGPRTLEVLVVETVRTATSTDG